MFSASIGVSEEHITALQGKMKENPFVSLHDEYSSYYRINKHTQKSTHYIEPREIKLPPDDMGKISTFQYIPVAETLEAIISDPDFKQLEQPVTPEGLLYDIKDGSAWKNNSYFKKNPNALTGLLYSDALALDNPLGASKGVNKVVNVYLSLVDVPKCFRSKTENVFLVLIIKETDLTKENYKHVFQPLIEDLKKLETGVLIGDNMVQLGIICYCADNLEASIVGGFSQCFSSFDVCRVCHQQHKDLSSVSGIPKAELWTREEYNAVVADIEPGTHGDFGTSSACLFNDLEAFHCVGQMPLDIMHDFMEKVAACDAMSILKALVGSGVFSFEKYNSVLNDVKLGDYETADRPLLVSPKSKKIPGKAMAVNQQLRLMPFFIWRILGGITEDSDLINLLVLLARIQEYLMADKLSYSDTDDFQELVVEFFSLRQLCEQQHPVFIKLTPKYHYLGTVPAIFGFESTIT
jgi:hypothetical protein